MTIRTAAPGQAGGAADPAARRPPVLLPALAGLLCGGLTLAVADLVAGLAGRRVAPSATPLLAVGGAFVDRTPGWLKDFAIATFGANDKLALLTGMALTVAALSAVAGVLGRRSAGAAVAVVLALGAVAAAAAATRPDATALSALPSVVGVLAGAACLVAVTAPLRHGRRPRRRTKHPVAVPHSAPEGTGPQVAVPQAAALQAAVPESPVGGSDGPEGGPAAPASVRRRGVLGGLAITAALTAAAGGAGRILAARRGEGLGPAGVTLPRPAQRAPAIPGTAQVDVPGVTPFVTPNRDFYRVDTALAIPALDAGTWRLRLHGQVERPVELTYADLLAMPSVERTITLTCVSNEVGGTLAGTATWLGVPLAAVLERAGVRPDADMLLSRSSDGFTASTPLAAVLDGRDALLAVGMNGATLPRRHGFPVRMVVPGLYGYVSATKWLVDLEVTRFDRAAAYWTDRGWAPRAPIKTFSRIDVPRPLARVRAGRVTVAGVAWAQRRGIQAVEVRVDGGPWRAARLATAVSPDTWRQWTWAWDATPGTHTLEVRSTDGTGATQPQDRRPPKPDGATGWHSVVVSVI